MPSASSWPPVASASIRVDRPESRLSKRMEAAGPPDIASALNGDPNPAYTLDDMAADAAGLLDALGIEAAHIVGASMGGFVSQLITINHPGRVQSLTSIMSGPSLNEGVPPTPEGAALLFARPPSTREESVEMALAGRRLLVGSSDPFDEAFERAKIARLAERAYYPI